MTRVMARLGAVIIVLGVTFSLLSAQPAGKANAIEIRDLMTADQFNRTGLAKLTPSELATLEEWLRTYTEAVGIGARSSTSNPGA
jgi:hypothetical protein